MAKKQTKKASKKPKAGKKRSTSKSLAKRPAKAPVGRPRLYSSPSIMEEAIGAYIQECNDFTIEKVVGRGDNERVVTIPLPKAITIGGITRALGFESRHSLMEYGKLYPEFSSTIARVREAVQCSMEELSLSPLATNGQVTGAKFNLERNFEPMYKPEEDKGFDEEFMGAIRLPPEKKPTRIYDGTTGKLLSGKNK